MNFFVNTAYRPSRLVLGLETFEPKTLYVVVRDAKNKNTQYTNRYNTVDGREEFEILMPVSPQRAEVIVRSERELSGEKNDNQYKVYKARLQDLYTGHMNFSPETGRKQADDFIKFAEEFAARASYASAGGSVYTSDDGKYKIKYLDVIKDNRTGRELKTPARISRTTGIIEVSKQHFATYTVPMRMAILLHEFSHFYVNDNSASEDEADLNALAMYLERGYPTVDAYNVFTMVFAESPTAMNKDRFDQIDNFIKSYRG